MSIQKINSNTLAEGAVLNSVTSSVNFRNRIINGDMRIDQRNAGVEVNPAADITYYLDRWKAWSTAASKFKIGQNAGAVTPPTGFTNYLGITSLAATSLGATDNYAVSQQIEGFNIADLGWGSATAQPITISFWVRSSLTGTFGGALNNSGSSRSYPFTFAISAANTWEQKTLTIAGDTTGTWLTTNGMGVYLVFGLGCGTTRSGTAGSWNSDWNFSATGAVSVVGTSGATFYITGVQLEAGSVATPFERRPYGTELALCQRYFTLCQLGISSGIVGFVDSSTSFIGYFYLPVEMRSLPTLTTSGTAADYLIRYTGGNTITCNAVPTINNPSTNIARVQATVASGLTGGQAAALASAAGSKTLGFNSEL